MFADKKNLLSVCVAVVLLCLGFFIGQMYRPIKKSKKSDFRSEKAIGLINPLLDCAELENVSNKTILNTRDNVTSYIESVKKEGVETVAVYFRDLNNGPWFGISEKEDFLPASLLKVPMMIAVLRQAMIDENFLKKEQVSTFENENNGEFFRGISEIKKGETYTVDEAVQSMILHSDNNASKFLGSLVDISILKKTFIDLGAEFPDKPNYSLSIRTYASFFRILYNSTFLNQELSEKALRLLSETDFKAGLVAGVPKKLVVAHKFGERHMPNGTKQLHDCGIVYYPDKPYIICVMTRGKNFDQLASVIARISEEVYAGVHSD